MLSVNALARPLVERLLAQAEALELSVNRDTTGACIVDAGIQVRGSIAAGLLIGEICMGGLGRVRLRGGGLEGWPSWIEVFADTRILNVMKLFSRTLSFSGGYAPIPAEPGLGFDFDDAAVGAFATDAWS